MLKVSQLYAPCLRPRGCRSVAMLLYASIQTDVFAVAVPTTCRQSTLHSVYVDMCETGLQVRGNWSEEAPRAIPPYRDYLLVCYQDDGCLLQGFACTHMQAPCEVSPSVHLTRYRILRRLSQVTGTRIVPITLVAETRRSHRWHASTCPTKRSVCVHRWARTEGW
jgi:hypothetical protein